MRAIIALGSLALFAGGSFGQIAAGPVFDVASVKPSQHAVGRDASGEIVTGADRLSGRNVTLKDLIAGAYHLERYQVSGGPRWLDSDEFDIDARAGGPVSKEQLGLMLQALLAERFHLALHREAREARVYVLGIAEHGPKIHPATEEDRSAAKAPAAGRRFHGDLHQLANLLSVQLSIPEVSDPTRPAIAGSPVPVLDQTGLPGIYDFSVDVRPEAGGDMFLLWQRVLRDQLGLKLEGQKAKVEFLVVDRAERTPAAN
jgi:uncharacterized protein (TIGR03435 family)